MAYDPTPFSPSSSPSPSESVPPNADPTPAPASAFRRPAALRPSPKPFPRLVPMPQVSKWLEGHTPLYRDHRAPSPGPLEPMEIKAEEERNAMCWACTRRTFEHEDVTSLYGRTPTGVLGFALDTADKLSTGDILTLALLLPLGLLATLIRTRLVALGRLAVAGWAALAAYPAPVAAVRARSLRTAARSAAALILALILLPSNLTEGPGRIATLANASVPVLASAIIVSVVPLRILAALVHASTRASAPVAQHVRAYAITYLRAATVGALVYCMYSGIAFAQAESAELAARGPRILRGLMEELGGIRAEVRALKEVAGALGQGADAPWRVR